MKAAFSGEFPSGLPPWTWVWVLSILYHLPSTLHGWFAAGRTIFGYYDTYVVQQGAFPWLTGKVALWLYAGLAMNHLPQAAMLVGLGTILVPSLRARWIEQRFRLGPPPLDFGTLNEIQAFTNRLAPELQIKVNFNRPGWIFTYPTKYRQATLAIFSGFIILWKTDREAAEAVLLHEITHYRRGDALLLGPGSFMETAAKLTLRYIFFFMFLPLALLPFVVAVDVFILLDLSAGLRLDHVRHLGWVIDQLMSSTGAAVIALPLLLFSVTAQAFILPIACLWSAEFNADYCVASDARYRDGLIRELSKVTTKVGWKRRLVFRLSHPPQPMRRFFLQRRRAGWVLLLLLLFPLAELTRSAVHYLTLISFAMVNALVNEQPPPIALPALFLNLPEVLLVGVRSNTVLWLSATVLLLIWSVAGRSWDRSLSIRRAPALLVAGSKHSVINVDVEPGVMLHRGGMALIAQYVIAAIFTGGLLMLALADRGG